MKLWDKIKSLGGSQVKKIGKLTDSGFFSEFFFPSRRHRTDISPVQLQAKYRVSELSYACINKIADVSLGARLIVQRRVNDEWEEIEDHPLSNILRFPNPWESGREIRKKDIQSRYSSGYTFWYLMRPRPKAAPTQIVILNPTNVKEEVDSSTGEIRRYIYRDEIGRFHDLRPEDVLMRRQTDITNEYRGLSPLQVALSAIEADINQTDFVNAFFESGGVPAGVLTFERTLTPEQKEEQQKLWTAKYSTNGKNRGEVAVMDKGVTYEPIGLKVGSDMEAGDNQSALEAKICGVFGVPPILVNALVGLVNVNQRASVRESLQDFGQNKIVPELADQMEWLTIHLLAQFENPNTIRTGRIRVWYDASDVPALQEDIDKVHERARKNARDRIWMLNEARVATGVPALPPEDGDIFLQPQNIRLIAADNEPINDPAELVAVDAAQTSEIDEVEEDEKGRKYLETKCPKCESGSYSPECSLCKGAGQVRLIAEPIAGKAQKKNCKHETKVYEYEGLVLGRKPRGVELVIDLKRLLEDQEKQSDLLIELLLRLRQSLINQAVRRAETRTSENIFELTLLVNERLAETVFDLLADSYDIGRDQVRGEVAAQRAAAKSKLPVKQFLDEDSRERVRGLSVSTISKMISEIQGRAINAFLRLTVLGVSGDDLIEQLRELLFGESIKWVEGLGRDNTNASVQTGRTDEIVIQLDTNGGGLVEYSALLDRNTCQFCRQEDGDQASRPEDLQPVPNPDCEGGSRCRCFHVYIEDPGGLEGDLA